LRIRTVLKAFLWIAAIALTGLLVLVLWLTFPRMPGSARSLKFEGFVSLPKDRRAGLLTVLDYLTLNGKDLFVSEDNTPETIGVLVPKGNAVKEVPKSPFSVINNGGDPPSLTALPAKSCKQ